MNLLIRVLVLFFILQTQVFGQDSPPPKWEDDGAFKGIAFTYNCTTGVTCAKVGRKIEISAAGGGGAPDDADYLIGTTNGDLASAIVVGTTPGGELGNTWASPTIDDNVTVTGWTMGTSVATTPSASDNDTSLATTAFVQSEFDLRPRAIGITIDGGGAVITTGIKGYIEVPYACTITRATVLLDQSGSIVIDVWKDTYANYPPTDADSITASAPPTVSTATKSQDATLTGWTTSIAAGNILGFNVDSITTATRAHLILKCDT